MPIIGDLRKHPLNKREWLYLEVDQKDPIAGTVPIPATLGIVHGRAPDRPLRGPVYLVHRETIKHLKRVGPLKQGWLLRMGKFRWREVTRMLEAKRKRELEGG